MDVAQFALSVEDLLRPFPRQTQRLREGSQKFDDLCNVIVIFAVLSARLGIEQVVASDQLENLDICVRLYIGEGGQA